MTRLKYRRKGVKTQHTIKNHKTTLLQRANYDKIPANTNIASLKLQNRQNKQLHKSIQNNHLHIFEPNTKGRDLVVGDIHGHFEILEKLLKKINFSTTVDRLFSTGDLVDRGPYSEHVEDWLRQPWFRSVRGNHEQMVIDYMAGKGDETRHIRNGGEWFYHLPEKRKKQIAEALQAMPLAIEVALRNGKNIGIIHAESPYWEDRIEWRTAITLFSAQQPDVQHTALQQSIYSRNKITKQDTTKIIGIEVLYVGHSTVNEILNLGNVTYIDTGCSFSDGKLSAIDLLSKEAYFSI